MYKRQDYHYELPEELIAQYPIDERDRSRLLIVDRSKQSFEEIPFREIIHYLDDEDLLVFNNTKVIPARLKGKRAGGGLAEIFLVKSQGNNRWEALVRPGRKLRENAAITFAEGFNCKVEEVLDNGNRIVAFEGDADFFELLAQYGEIPLPPYIKREANSMVDKSRYQTVYAKERGAVAAPTAGLHFTPELLAQIKQNGISIEEITLHVGLGTFKPVQVDDIREHKMHGEHYVISESAACRLNSNKKRRICVGTTSCRALESAADADGTIRAGASETDIFIYPGYSFKYMQGLVTNFHLPGSTLLMLVSAFAGKELMMEAYKKAVKDRFRFFSYGDAMLIL